MAALKLAQSGSLEILENADNEFEVLKSGQQHKNEIQLLNDYKWLTEVLFNKLSPILLGC